MIARRIFTVLLLPCLYAQTLNAQHLELDAAAVSRLGLVFMPIAAPDETEGARFPARVMPSPQVPSELHAIHGGVMEAWHAQPGDEVTKGQVLATIHSPSALALQQEWVGAHAASQQAAFELERDKSLHDQGIIARQRLLESERRVREAEFTLRVAESALAQTGYAADELDRLREGGSALGRYQVRAPFAGVLGHINHRIGNVIAQGDPILALREERLWVSAELPAMLATRVALGQTLRLADSGAELDVRVKETAIDQSTQTVGVLAEFRGPTDLLPGQIVTLLLPALDRGVTVPADAVVRDGNDTIVYVRATGGIERRVVSLQPLGANYLAVEGLSSGEELVVRGASLLKGITLGLGGE